MRETVTDSENEAIRNGIHAMRAGGAAKGESTDQGATTEDDA
jgi:hypothetical protein